MLNSLKFIFNHPLNASNRLKTFFRLLAWQINVRLNPFPIIYPFTKNSKLIVARGMTTATGNLYCGLFEFEDMGFLLHFLRQDDLFIDIGANIGSYTVLAAAERGAKVIAVEPIPATFGRLVDNIKVNGVEEQLRPLNIGLGNEKSILKFTKSFDAMNRVATENDKDTIDVPVDILDAVCKNESPILIKMDVEGFETEVIKGAHATLSNPSLKAIIIELSDYSVQKDTNKRGVDNVHDTLLSHGFSPVHYNPFKRTWSKIPTFTEGNTIYIRDEPFVTERVEQAPKIEVRGSKI